MAHALLTISGPEPHNVCRICDRSPADSFEHIPAKAANNKSPARAWTVDALFRGAATPGRFPRGVGLRSLCSACNSRTGEHYVPAFIRLIQALEGAVHRPASDQLCIHTGPFDPLLVAKQFAVMSLAVNPSSALRGTFGDSMRRHVVSPKHVGVPEDARFFLYHCRGGESRLCHFGAHVWWNGVKTVVVRAEVAVPPLGLVVLATERSTDAVARRLRLVEVTSWFSTTASRMDGVFLNLPALTPRGAAPLDYQGMGDPPSYPSKRSGKYDRVEPSAEAQL